MFARHPTTKLALALLTVAVTVGAGRSARAEPTLRAIFLPSELSANFDTTLRRALDARFASGLTAQKFTVMPADDLGEADRGCKEAACLAPLAERRDVDVIVRAKVNSDGLTPPSNYVTVWLFDRAKPQFVRREDSVCRLCSVAETADALAELARKALLPDAGDSSVTKLEGSRGSRRGTYRLLGGVAAGLAVVSAAFAIVEIARNGGDACSDGRTGAACPIQVSTTSGTVIGIAGAVVFTVAAVTMLVLAGHQDAPIASVPSVWVAPVADAHEIGVGVGGRF